MNNTIFGHFPLSKPRLGQTQSLQFIQDMVNDGVTDIIIEAPTGAGKSAIGAACCHWAGTWPLVTDGKSEVKPGGYYLVTQKALQDQIVKDVALNFKNKDFASLKSSEAYSCDDHGNCQIGLMVDKSRSCEGRKTGSCPYIRAREAFGRAAFSLTNYSYFMTEKLLVGQLPARQVMVLDECHTLERTLLKFGELVFTQALFKDWGMAPLRVPEYEEIHDFLTWVDKKYLPIVQDRLKALVDYAQMDKNAAENKSVKARITALQSQALKAKLAVNGALNNPDDWVYWCDQTDKDGEIVNLKPLNSAPYAPLLLQGAKHRIYMSAYPSGDRDLFCESLGLDAETVAWIKLPSAFKPENRPIVMGLVGSMSKRNQATTMPGFMRVVDKILTSHKNEKGIIHCNSYALGEKIYTHFERTVHGVRLIFPRNADERETAKAVHEKEVDRPTVLISPSMTEGFDFKDDLARWQIVAKMPYPYLGDKQVEKKKDMNPAWYSMQTASTIIQACGRIVRSEEDFGVTYILDSDFQNIWDRYRQFFPTWFRSAMVWPGKS